MKKLLPILVVVMLFVAVGTGYFAYSAYKDNVDKSVPASTYKDTEMEAELDNKEVETKVEDTKDKGKSNLNNSLSIELIEIIHRDPSQDGVYDYRLGAKQIITNHTDKDIKGFIGETYFYDMFGELIFTIDLKYEWKLIPANDSIEFYGEAGLNQFKDGDMRFFYLPFENMTFDYKISSIIFNDGTTISE
ncbi:hypothetical protein ACIQZG_15050 [Lysinibacillus sp. NPDC096418]|uniref:hypothetical protein n=1 Tax=Lysinibacillus sp. NPDC096418 TaxID=3364138 RepID=UPI0038022F14